MFDLYSDEIEQVTSIIYMAGSTDLLKAELNPADDLITHISQLHSFLDLLSSAKVKSLQRIFFFSSAEAIYGESICPQLRSRGFYFGPNLYLWKA